MLARARERERETTPVKPTVEKKKHREMLMEQRSEEERSQRGRHRGQTEKGNITNEPEERGSAEDREQWERGADRETF